MNARKAFWTVVITFLACAHGFSSARAGAPLMATSISGTVTDDFQRPIAGAQIIFMDSAENTRVVSESDGTFILTLPAGIYRLTVQAKGFDIVKREALVVGSQPLNVQIRLVALGALKTIANVSVTTRSSINVTPASINTLTSQQILAQGSIGLARALSEIPGVQITMASAGSYDSALAYEYAVNSPANPVYLGIRGSQAYENATLFDGHRLDSTDWIAAANGTGNVPGAFNLANIDMHSIASLDVVKGPGADSPVDNNAIGGVANIDPGVPSGKPSAMWSYGFDGSGGLQFNISAQGLTKNKRFGLSIGVSSHTVQGPIGGFGLFAVDATPFAHGFLNGTQLIGPTDGNGFTQFCVPVKPYYYSGIVKQTSDAIGCCIASFSLDTTIQQQRTISLLYNVAPTIQVILRYNLNNSYNDYNTTPILTTFLSPAGYAGKYPDGYKFFSVYNGGIPTREIDQLYEWDIHSQVGSGSLRLSYLSYSSSNRDFQSAPAMSACANCTLSGEIIVGEVFNPSLGFVGGTPTIFNDKQVNLSRSSGYSLNSYSETLTHDVVADFVYPIGNSANAGLSYNSTIISNYNQFDCLDTVIALGYPLQLGYGPLTTSHAGQFEGFSTLHATIHADLLRNVTTQMSLYMNQYQYHIPDPAHLSRFINTFSYQNVPRAGFEWRPSSDVAVRASAGGGIAPIDISNLVGSTQPPQPNGPPTTAYSVSLPNPHLQPESSFGEDLGMSVRLNRISTFSTDVYYTTLRGQFFTNQQQIGTYLGYPLYATQTRNLAHSKYEGLELTYERRPPNGLFYTLQGSLQRGFAYDVPASFYTSACGPYTTNLTIVPNENFSGGQSGIGRVAYAQGFAAIGWQNLRGLEISGNLTYYGNNNGLYRPAFVTIDLDGNLPISDRVSLSLALSNLTNIYPDLYYQGTEYSIIPYAHPFETPYFGHGDIGQVNTVQNVGPRHISATLSFKL